MAVSPALAPGLRRTQWMERSVLLLAYTFLAGVIAWALGRRGGPWVLRLREPSQQRVRLAAGMVDTAVGALGSAVLGLQLGGDDHALVLGWTIGAAVSLKHRARRRALGVARGPGTWSARPWLGPDG